MSSKSEPKALWAKVLERGTPTMSLDDTAKLIGVGRNQIFAAAKRGEIPTLRLGKRILVLCVPLAEMLQKQVSK